MSVSLTCMVDRQPGNGKLNIWDKIRKPEATIYKEQSPRLACKFIQLSTDAQVWSGPSLLINRIIGYYRMFQWRANVRMRLRACAGWSEYMHFVHVWRHFFFAWCGPYISYTSFHEISGNLKHLVDFAPFLKGRYLLWLSGYICTLIQFEKGSTLKGKNLLQGWGGAYCCLLQSRSFSDEKQNNFDRVAFSWMSIFPLKIWK